MGPGFESPKADQIKKGTSNYAFGVFLLQLYRGRELGADEFIRRLPLAKNSPVDCFAGGSREASPRRQTKRVRPNRQVQVGFLYIIKAQAR